MCQAWGMALGILCNHQNYPFMVTTSLLLFSGRESRASQMQVGCSKPHS